MNPTMRIGKVAGAMVIAIALTLQWGCEPGALRDLLTGLTGSGGEPPAGQAVPGPEGPAGLAGADGLDGADGANCWDLNGNGLEDAEEDVNGDGQVDVQDCQGVAGAEGLDGEGGADGLACWDLNGNGLADEDEDRNRDGVVDSQDCQGPSGLSGQIGQAGVDGADGLSCWDLNGNGLEDPEEDVNGDGAVDALDCRGPIGPTFFDFFVEDFWSAQRRAEGEIRLDDIVIGEVFLGPPAFPNRVRAIGYRAAMPVMYYDGDGKSPGNDVTMRLFFHRTGSDNGKECLVFMVDSILLQSGSDIAQYGETRWVRVDLPLVDEFDAGLRGERGDAEGISVAVDLPVNSVAGLGYPPLHAGDRLVFALTTVQDDGGEYHLLDVEFFESYPGAAILANAAVFDSEDDVTCTRCPSEGPDCNENGITDECELCGGDGQTAGEECLLDCDGNGIPDECELDCNGNEIPDACEICPLDGGTAGEPCLPDCNGNGILDECDLCDDDATAGVSGLECSLDCNGNGIPDECDGGCE